MIKCETFEELQTLGTEKIHERTHISRDKLELILTKSYSEIGKVQFMGFISILEREFSMDLNSIKEEYLSFRRDHESTLPPKESVILQASSNERQKWILAGTVLVIVLMMGGYYLQNMFSNSPSDGVIQLSNQAINVVQEIADTNLTTEEANASIETNSTAEANVTSAVTVDTNNTSLESAGIQKMAIKGSLNIRPIYKVWYGMIDLETGVRTQRITSDIIPVDTTKNWLIVLGHGRVEISSGNDKQLLKERGTVRLLYEKGLLKPITKDEFLERNDGNDW